MDTSSKEKAQVMYCFTFDPERKSVAGTDYRVIIILRRTTPKGLLNNYFFSKQLDVYVDVSEYSAVDIYFHNKLQVRTSNQGSLIFLRLNCDIIFQLHFPNYKNSYGSVRQARNSFKSDNSGTPQRYTNVYRLSKVQHENVDDRPQRPCVRRPDRADLSACVTRYAESRLGCRTYWIASNASLPECATADDVNELLDITAAIEEMNEVQIRGLTGCTPACNFAQVVPVKSSTTTLTQCPFNLA